MRAFKIYYLFIIVMLLLGLLLSLSSTACGKKKQTAPGSEQTGTGTAESEETHQERYHCPMHPSYTSDKPGTCPICGMNLTPIPAEKGTGKILTGTGLQGPQGLAPVTIAPGIGKRLGLTYGIIEIKPFVREIRTSARIAPDETRQMVVNSRVEGWVEKLYVNVTGQPVKKGSPLLTIYSPELVTAQQELLTAANMVKEFKDSDFENLSNQGQNILNAARQRLKFWEISDKQIEQIEKSGQVQETLTLYAPAPGFVSEKKVLPGQKIMAGEPLMNITDLSHVWALADIYEADIPYVKHGMLMEIIPRNLPNKTYTGKILFLEPGLEDVSRTLKARIDIVNKDLNLKPGMYADARLKIDLGKILTIPESAVIRSGERDYAFALGTEGQLQPLEVKIGARGDGFYELISGLYEGDKVVTSANFLIDSESSLKAALEAVSTQPAQTTTTTTTGTKPPTQNHSGHTGHSAHTGHSN